MKNKRHLCHPIVFLLIATGLSGFCPTLFAADIAGKVTSIYGQVLRSTGSENVWRPIYKNDRIYPGDEIKTGLRSGVSLILEDESMIRLGPASSFVVEAVEATSFWRLATAFVSSATQTLRSTFRLNTGRLWMRNNNRVNSQIVTTSATIGIRGTEITIEAGESETTVEVQEGSAQAQNEIGEEVVGVGERLLVEKGRGFSKLLQIRQRDAVQWTVAIPPVIDIRSLLSDQVQNDTAQQLVELFELNDYQAMSQIIQQQGSNGEVWFQLQAWVDLHSGNSAEAYDHLKRHINTGTASVESRELAAFAAIINDDLEQAREILKRLMQREELTANGYVIYGYLEQSQFDLTTAIQSYREALRLDRNNITARIQLARALFGSDLNQQARTQINIALRADSSNRSALNLLGFILLANLETSEAIKTWDMLANEANDETHFGYSIAYMRQGKVDQAFENIAMAVLLNPQKSIYLSYWGKMLYQVGRLDKSLTVLDSAIRLDSKDPTPHLYRAIILRDLNRPGEAISEIQAAIKLNDFKGVYRSRSLLDKDLAVQNVDLSRLYNQLGLSDWAQLKATASLKSDYSNVSAHILNAGAFAQLEDRSYPLLSAALLARLMQPANTNAFSSFNNYTSMFEAPSTEHIVELGGGNHGQESLSYISYGANPESHTAWSFAAIHEASDGWRDNNGESFDDISIIGKWQPDDDSNFLFTASVFETGIDGDLSRRFEIDADEDELAEFTSTSLQLEFGLHQRLSNSHELLLHLSLLQNQGELTDNIIDQEIPVGPSILTQERIVDGDFERPLTQLQLQGLIKKPGHQIFYGALVFDGKNNIDASQDYGLFDPDHMLVDPLLTFDEQTDEELDISFSGIYLQDSWQVTPSLLVDAAIYRESIDNANPLTGGEWSVEETSPRLGLVWQASASHTLRLAAFQYLLPFVSARLDPIDVAGVPIFKNTNEGSLVKEVDLVWDYEWERGLFSVNFYKLEEEFTSSILAGGQQLESTSDGEKQGARFTGNWLLGLRTGLRAEVETFELEDESLPSADREESRLSLGVSHVFNNGLTLSAEEVLKELDFESSRDSESIEVINLNLFYEFDQKRQAVTLEVINVLDEEFNWVTDEFAVSGIPPARLVMGRYRVTF